MVRVTHLRHYLDHPWHFKRHIVHHHSNQVADIDGTVSWREASGRHANHTRLYCESGVIRLANYTGKATQTYRYDFLCNEVAEVYFSDGRFFYTLDLTSSCCDIQHPCGEDIYEGRFEAISETEYQQTWRVTGPHKDYTSRTIFSHD